VLTYKCNNIAERDALFLDFPLFYQNFSRNAENSVIFSGKASILSILTHIELPKTAQNKQSILRVDV